MSKEAGLKHHVERRVHRAHRQQIAAEGRAVGAGGHALGRRVRRQHGADWKTAAERLGERHDVGRHAAALIAEQSAGPPHAALHLVEHQHKAVLVTKIAQRSQERRLDNAHAAFAHQRLDHDGRCFFADRAFDGIEIAERNLVEAFDDRSETVEIFLLAASCQRRQRSAMEGALESDDAIALGPFADRLIFAGALDGAFHRFGARIAEERDVGEARRAEALRGALLFRNFIKVGDVPSLLRLFGKRSDKVRMRVAQRIDGNAGGEIEIALAVRGEEPYAFAPLESEVHAREGRHQMRCHGFNPHAARRNSARRK